MTNHVPMTKDNDYIEVHPETVDQHKALGWMLTAPRAAAGKPSDGLSVAEIKAALAEKGVDIPEGVTLKADLAALLDAS